jgi:hypothetical protein
MNEWAGFRAVEVRGNLNSYCPTGGNRPRSPELLEQYDDSWGNEESRPSLNERLIYVLNSPENQKVRDLPTTQN